jgi:hypothetical protein
VAADLTSQYAIAVARTTPFVFVTEFKARTDVGFDWMRLYRVDLTNHDEQTLLSADVLPADPDAARMWIVDIVTQRALIGLSAENLTGTRRSLDWPQADHA